ncbi:MAG: CHAT domain-containing protein, partial [bacterium]
MSNTEFFNLKKKGLEYFKNKKHIKATDYIEKALSITYDEELEKALAKSSYMAIWDSYTGKNFEKMENYARLSININSKKKYYKPLILAKSYNGLSIALYNLGKRNIENNLKAKEIYEDILSKEHLKPYEKKQIIRSKIYNNIGIIINLGYEGNINDTTLLCEENITLCNEYDMLLELGVSYKVYAELLYYFGNFDLSLSYFRQALKELFKKKENATFKHHIGDIYLKVAINFLKEDKQIKALEVLDKAIPYLEYVRKNEFRFYYIRGAIFENYGELKEASEYYNKAFNLLLHLKSVISAESNVDSSLSKEDRENTFKSAISIQHKLKNPFKFTELLEKYRGKEFIEKVLQGKRTALQGIPIGLKDERNKLENEIKNTINNTKLSPEEKSEKIKNLEDKLYFCEEKITSSKRVYKLYGESINIELSNILNNVKNTLKPKQAIITYFYHKDGIYITLIKNNKIKLEYIDVAKSNFEEILKNYLDYLRSYSFNSKSSKKILSYYQNEISQYLISPIKSELSNDMEIVIVPFETLHLFPMHMIFLELFPDIKVSLMPSLASILYIRTRKQLFNDICIFADPENNLPSVINEVEKIPLFFNNYKVLFREKATKKSFLKYWDKYDILHYSGHFRHKYDKPLYSYIECNNNEKITLSKIYELNSEKTTFLTLGSCSSGLSRIYKGEELTGMIRGFFYAGIKSILATLWDVEDKSA